MIDPDKVYQKAVDQAEDYADKSYAAGVLSDGLDTLKGQIMAELRSKGDPVTLISSLSRTDQRWIDMAKQVRDAEKAALIAKLKYEQVNRWQDNVRTNEATIRKHA